MDRAPRAPARESFRSARARGADLLAGVTLAAYAIPVSLAYASLAGLPPEVGLYGYLLGGLGYAALGSSRHLAIGPTSAISMLVGASVAPLAAGGPARLGAIASLAALEVGVLCVLAWALKLSSLTSFISETVLLGFKAGAGLSIAATQLPTLLGVGGGGVAGGLSQSAVNEQAGAGSRWSLVFASATLALCLLFLTGFVQDLPKAVSGLARNPDNETVPGVIAFRVESGLVYFNVEHVRRVVRERIAAAGPALRHVVCDLSTSPYVDLAGARMLQELSQELGERGASLRVVEAHGSVRDLLRAMGLEEHVGRISRRVSLADAVADVEDAP